MMILGFTFKIRLVGNFGEMAIHHALFEYPNTIFSLIELELVHQKETCIGDV
jgi:hypothetical protein